MTATIIAESRYAGVRLAEEAARKPRPGSLACPTRQRKIGARRRVGSEPPALAMAGSAGIAHKWGSASSRAAGGPVMARERSGPTDRGARWLYTFSSAPQILAALIVSRAPATW